MRVIFCIMLIFLSVFIFAQDESNDHKIKTLTKGDFINLTIYNKGLMPRRGYVEGPKKNGKTFSYGLNVGPFIKIKKYWSVGTKFFVKQNGKYVTAYEVTAEDKDQVVDISRKH